MAISVAIDERQHGSDSILKKKGTREKGEKKITTKHPPAYVFKIAF